MDKFEIMNRKDVVELSPERVRIAKIFKAHIDRAVEELDVHCEVIPQANLSFLEFADY